MQYTSGQIMSWYHSKIPQILHGKQTKNKNYLDDEYLLKLFEGTTYIDEKLDGKMSCVYKFIPDTSSFPINNHGLQKFYLCEDLSCKNSPHSHVLKYKSSQKINFDIVEIINDKPIFYRVHKPTLTYNSMNIRSPSINLIKTKIFDILKLYSQMPSHYGSQFIEGLVIKNYDKQLMAKWINDQFEDNL